MAQTYSINDLERLTGIKAHTVRIWEKRYGLLSPVRTVTNIRTYSDDDLRKILNVNTLLREGWKISHISALSEQELEAEVWNSAKTNSTDSHVYEIYIQALVSSALAFDEEWFETVFAEVKGRFGLELTMEHITGPFLERVGLMWSVVKMHPGQEHFASNLVRRKIFTAIDALALSNRRGKCLLFLPEWEEHEIGLLYAWYLFRSAGFHVIYLGQRVPMQALIQSIDAIHPDLMLLFLVTEEKPETINSYLSQIVMHAPQVPVYAAAKPHLFESIGKNANVRVLDSAKALKALLSKKTLNND